jgi:hypothetical protein
MMEREEYTNMREFFRLEAVRFSEENNSEKSNYYTGIVRGLDYAFQANTASKASV